MDFDPVTRIAGGTTNNVIPSSVEMEGTIRTFDAELRHRIPVLMERILAGVTSAHGAHHKLSIEKGYRPVINDERASDLLDLPPEAADRISTIASRGRVVVVRGGREASLRAGRP